jgi:hypothetical protein
MTKSCEILRCFFTHHSVSALVAISNQNELTTLIAQEDCAASRIVKDETQGEAEVGRIKKYVNEDLADETEVGQPKECSKEGPVDGENDEGKDSDDDDSSDSEDNGDEGRNKASTKKIGGETYAQGRERNIMENKKLLEELNVKSLVQDLKEGLTTTKKRCVFFVTMTLRDNSQSLRITSCHQPNCDR